MSIGWKLAAATLAAVRFGGSLLEAGSCNAGDCVLRWQFTFFSG